MPSYYNVIIKTPQENMYIKVYATNIDKALDIAEKRAGRMQSLTGVEHEVARVYSEVPKGL